MSKPDDDASANQRPSPFDHVFVATDFSAGAGQALARAARLPLAKRGKITVRLVRSDRIPKKLVPMRRTSPGARSTRRRGPSARPLPLGAVATSGSRPISARGSPTSRSSGIDAVTCVVGRNEAPSAPHALAVLALS